MSPNCSVVNSPGLDVHHTMANLPGIMNLGVHEPIVAVVRMFSALPSAEARNISKYRGISSLFFTRHNTLTYAVPPGKTFTMLACGS